MLSGRSRAAGVGFTLLTLADGAKAAGKLVHHGAQLLQLLWGDHGEAIDDCVQQSIRCVSWMVDDCMHGDAVRVPRA